MTKSEGESGNQQVIAKATLYLAIATILLVIVTGVIAIINMVQLSYIRKSNDRAEQIFQADKKPLVDVAPISIMQNVDGTHVTTLLTVTNYSGFTAYQVAVDLKYGETWIGEWLKASNSKQNDCGVVKADWYVSSPGFKLGKLEPGETRTTEGLLDKKGAVFSGSLSLEKDVMGKGNKGLPITVRVAWENEKGHVFDTGHEYQLIGTKAGKGRSFTFIPKGIVSQKDVR